jgi:hypothetical protein
MRMITELTAEGSFRDFSRQTFEGNGQTWLILREKIRIQAAAWETPEHIHQASVVLSEAPAAASPKRVSGVLRLKVVFERSIQDMGEHWNMAQAETETLAARAMAANVPGKAFGPLDAEAGPDWPAGTYLGVLWRPGSLEGVSPEGREQVVEIPWRTGFSGEGSRLEAKLEMVHGACLGLGALLIEALIRLTAAPAPRPEAAELCWSEPETLLLTVRRDRIWEVLGIQVRDGLIRPARRVQDNRWEIFFVCEVTVFYLRPPYGGPRLGAAVFLMECAGRLPAPDMDDGAAPAVIPECGETAASLWEDGQLYCHFIRDWFMCV